MNFLPPSKPGDRTIRPRTASTVLLKPVVVASSEPVKSRSDAALLPSIHSSGRDVISLVGSLPTLPGTEPEVKKKKGRPTKAEKMKERRARVSEGIKALADDDPTKADVQAYFDARIKHLLEEV